MIALLQKKCGSNQIHMCVTYNMTTGIDFGSFVCFFLGFVCALSIFWLSCRECYNLESFKLVFLPLWLPYPLASWIFSLPVYLSQLVVFFLIKPCNMGLTIIYWSQNRLQWKSSQFQKLACNHAVGFQCLISWLTVSHHYSCGTPYITSWSYLGFR